MTVIRTPARTSPRRRARNPLAALRHPALARLSAVAIVVGAATALPVITPPAAKAHPVAPHTSFIAIGGVDSAALNAAPAPGASERQAPAATVVAFSPETPTRTFRLVGVTWKGTRSDVYAFVRVRQEGNWSTWHALDTDTGHAPDQSTAEATRARGGSEPLVVAPANGVQVRVESAHGKPQDLKAVTVDPGTSGADASIGAAPSSSAAAQATRPTYYTRAQWGADESMRRADPSYGTIKAGFVHHTDNANDYTQAEVPAIIRAIYAFHVNGRGWNDIGYNFLVDKFGRIWEGRYGGVARPVIGAHTAGYNSVAFGMSVIGNYTSYRPSTSVMNAYKRVFAWKLGLHHVNPVSRVNLSNGTTTKNFYTVSGHRDAGSTACPGTALYNRIPDIRTGARALQGTMFYTPIVSRTSWPYRDDGMTVTTSATGPVKWRLTVRNSAGSTVNSFSGSATVIRTGWSGRMSTGGWAPPGAYYLTLTAYSQSGTLYTAVPWTQRITVTTT